ncbi:MAG: hypothetical protein U0T81_13505 [Saprospiraceae bacterium]
MAELVDATMSITLNKVELFSMGTTVAERRFSLLILSPPQRRFFRIYRMLTFSFFVGIKNVLNPHGL